MIKTGDIFYKTRDVANPTSVVSERETVKQPCSLDDTLHGNPIRETVSYKHYDSNFLLKVRSKCNFNFPTNINTASLNILKKFNLIKPFPNDFCKNQTKKVGNTPLKQKINPISQMCPQKIPPSPKCKAPNSFENVYPFENASLAPLLLK